MADIDLMGRRLAVEVQDFLEEGDDEDDAVGVEKISFIAFSLGGLILRAALPRLSTHKEMFHAFVTLSSPHMGYLSNDSRLVKTGIWAWQKFTGKGAPQQLAMQDSKIQTECLLYKLCENKCLSWFNHISLFSSV